MHSQPFNPARTTSRFYTDENYRDEETAYLLLAPLEKARQAFVDQDGEKAKTILDQLRENFPHVCRKFTHYLLLQGSIAVEEMDFAALHDCLAHLDDLTLDLAQEKTVQLFRAYLAFEPGDEQSLPKEFASLNKLKAQIKQFNFAEVSL